MKTALATLFGAIATLVVVGVVTIYWISGETLRKEKEVSTRRSALDRLSTVLSTLKDAETGQRGYLLTSEEQYLVPYDTARATIHGELAKLSRSMGSQQGTVPDFNRFVT